VTLFVPGPPVLAGVDAVLRTLTTEALRTLNPAVGVTVGPLDRPADGPRLNWFLYHVEPSASYVNMEPPQRGGWTTRRGRPPLALTLRYLLSADCGELVENGDEDEFVHAGLSAVMSALHDNGIIGPQSPIATAPDRTVSDVTAALDEMIEPLRITPDIVPIETITALWNSGSHAVRLSVGYQVSLVTVPAQLAFSAGPPVCTRVVGVAPSMAPVISSITPQLVAFDDEITVHVRGVADQHQITLGRVPGDPPNPADPSGPWPLAAAGVPGGFTVHLPNAHLAPGRRPLIVTNLAEGLPAGSGHGVVTVVPRVVSGPAQLQAGTTATLTVRHVVGDGEVFFNATSAPYTIVTADTIDVTVPPLPAAPTVAVSLRVGTISGPSLDMAVHP
jgi:hypothetical protein